MLYDNSDLVTRLLHGIHSRCNCMLEEVLLEAMSTGDKEVAGYDGDKGAPVLFLQIVHASPCVLLPKCDNLFEQIFLFFFCQLSTVSLGTILSQPTSFAFL